MAYILFNLAIEKDNKSGVNFSDRGLQYGDGLFETMITQDGSIRFVQDHIDRIKKGLKELQINYPTELQDPSFLHEQYLLLKKKNNIEGECRIKLMIWRKEGGLYTPSSNDCYSLLSAQEYKSKGSSKGLKVGFAETIKVPCTPVSFCKTLSSMTYTFAGLEKKKRELDDLILFNAEGYITETISGNVFWIKGKDIFTPKVSTGCVAGIARKNIVSQLEQKGYKVKKVCARKADIMEADSVLSSNVTGVSMIKQIDEKQFKVVDAWRKLFEQAYHI